MCSILGIALAGSFVFSSCRSASAAEWVVSVDGADNAAGTLEDPWSKEMLAPLLHGHISQVAAPGDTIYLRGGTYYGHFYVTVSGASGNRIRIAPYPGEHVVIHGGGGYPTLTMAGNQLVWLKGDHIIFEGFEVTMTMESRWRILGSDYDRYWDGVVVVSAESIVRNLIVHNIHGPGIVSWSSAENTHIHSCICFHNGYESVNRAAGHNFYLQNNEGIKKLTHNILFLNFGYGVHMYTEEDKIKNMSFTDNVVFNSGKLGYDDGGSNILVGGKKPFDNITIDDNYFYNSDVPSNADGVPGSSIAVGYWTEGNTNAYVRNNLVVGGHQGLGIRNTNSIIVTGNEIHIMGSEYYPRLIRLSNLPTSLDEYIINNNKYYFAPGGRSFTVGDNRLSWSDWRTTYPAFDNASEYAEASPARATIKVARHPDSAWGYIAVHNPEGATAVDVDLSTILALNTEYFIYDVEQLFEEPLVEGTYDGNLVSVPMDQLQTDVTQPVGARYSNDDDAAAKINPLADIIHTPSEFGVYIVMEGKIADSYSDPHNAISILQLLTGGSSVTSIPSILDINSDEKIGLAEAIYYLKSQ